MPFTQISLNHLKCQFFGRSKGVEHQQFRTIQPNTFKKRKIIFEVHG